MVYEDRDQNMNKSAFDGVKDKLDSLDPKQKLIVILILGAFFVAIVLNMSKPSGEGDMQQPTGAPDVRKVSVASESEGGEEIFSADGADESVIRRNFVTQTLGEVESLKEEIRRKDSEREKESTAQAERLKSLESQLDQSIRALNEDRRSFQETIARQQEENARLLQDMREQRIKDKEASGSEAQQRDFLSREPIREQRRMITQQPLSFNDASIEGTPLVEGLTGGRPEDGYILTDDGKLSLEDERKPFIPPLGFIKGTLLNGVDALTAGTTTPALVRLEGVYKTAMNSVVTLDGCFMLVEFQGDISTERAKGKPARMTCVYPDQGSVTYSVSGYVVDSEDGIEGVPGLFFEGHAGRIALAIAAEFASGIADVIESNQSTSVVGSDGTTVTTITGSQTRAALYGSAADSISSLEDYLMERASRVVPFIRIDGLREIHIVLLSGTELRSEGDAWSQLFEADENH